MTITFTVDCTELALRLGAVGLAVGSDAVMS